MNFYIVYQMMNNNDFIFLFSDNNVMVCVGSHTNTLLVYKETQLKWASQLPFTPVSLQKSNLKVRITSLITLNVCF